MLKMKKRCNHYQYFNRSFNYRENKGMPSSLECTRGDQETSVSHWDKFTFVINGDMTVGSINHLLGICFQPGSSEFA